MPRLPKHRIITRWIDGKKAYFFRYTPMRGMTFEFSMLCEVGQPYIPEFERMIAARGLKLVTVHIEQKPWVITVEKPETDQPSLIETKPTEDARYQRGASLLKQIKETIINTPNE